ELVSRPDDVIAHRGHHEHGWRVNSERCEGIHRRVTLRELLRGPARETGYEDARARTRAGACWCVLVHARHIERGIVGDNRIRDRNFPTARGLGGPLRCGAGGVGDHVAAGALSPERETIHICTEGVSMVLYPGRGTADLRGCTLPRRVVLGGEFVLDRDHQVALISEFAQ